MTEASEVSAAGGGCASGASELAAQGRPLVGRDSELTALRRALDAAVSGAGGLRLIAGEPGIGKTRLAEELCEHARNRGVLTLWGACGKISGAPAYGPWAQILGTYVRDTDDHALVAQLGAGAAQVAQIVPEIRARLPERCEPAPAALRPEHARLALFDAVGNFLLRASAERPLLLVLDDVHTADAASLLLLRFVAKHLDTARVLIIAAYREVEAALTPVVAVHLDELLRHGRCTSLHGLATADIAALIERGYALSPAPELVADLHRSTRGNPFFVHMLVTEFLNGDRRLDRERLLGRPHRMPGDVHQAIRERLDYLGADTVSVLAAAAACGDEFDVDVVERVTGCPRSELLERLAHPTMTRMLVRSPAQPGRYAFAHALVREAVYESLAPARRARLHRQIAESIEALHGADIGPYLADLSHHAHEAMAAGGDSATAVDYAARAGDWAAAQLAYEPAAAHYERALHTLGRNGDADPQRRFELHLAMSQMLNAVGRSADAREALRNAAGLARRLGDSQLLARTALAFGIISTQIQGGTPDAELIDLLVESRSALGQEDTGTRAMVIARLAYELQMSSEPARIQAMAHDAIASSRRLGEPATLAYVLMCAEPALGWSDLDARFARAAEMIRLAEMMGSAELAMMGRIRRVRAFVECGELAAADAEASELGRVADQARLLASRWWLRLWEARHAAMTGAYERAEQLTHEAYKIGEVVNRHGAELHRDLQLMVLCRDQGRYAEFDALLQPQLRRQVHVAARCLACLLDAECNDMDSARAEFEQLAAADFSTLRDDHYWLLSVIVLAEVCALLQDTERAAALYERLAPYAERCVYSGVAAAYHGNVARALGQLATTRRRWTEAQGHFEAALRIDARMGARPWLARTQYDYARMRLARNGDGDRSAARALLRQAHETAQSLGMQPLFDEVAGCLASCADDAPTTRPVRHLPIAARKR